MDKGLYFAYETIEDEIGLSFNVNYNKAIKDFQISVMILDTVFAVGWTF